MKIAVGSDHAGYELKEILKEHLISLGHEVQDFGTHSVESVDYPDFGIAVGEAVSEGRFERGIVCCGSGIGISISANKVRGVRCALCYEPLAAEMSRRHNDANVLALGGRMTSPEIARKIVDIWLSTSFESGRHQRRIDKITTYETNTHQL